MARKIVQKIVQEEINLPPFVVLKFDPPQWYVRRGFPTGHRDAKGRIVYDQISRRCLPETQERAKELSDAIESAYKLEFEESQREKSVGEFFQSFLATKKKSVGRRTYEDYETLFERYMQGKSFCQLPIADLTTRKLQAFVDELETGGVSGSMIRRLFILVSMAVRQAVIWEDLAKDPLPGLILPKKRTTEASALPKSKANALIQECRKKPEYLVFQFAIETGMRPEEFLAQTWADLDLERCRARIRRVVTTDYKGGGFELGDPKTKDSIRTVGFSPALAERLKKHRQLQETYIAELKRKARAPLDRKHKIQKGVNYKKRKAMRARIVQKISDFKRYDLVFPASNGKPQSRTSLGRREFKDVLKVIGVGSGISLKSLRHTNASLLAEKISPKRLQKHLGHSTIITTLKYYVHVDEEAEFEISDKFEEALA